jgi:hypothetical protein
VPEERLDLLAGEDFLECARVLVDAEDPGAGGNEYDSRLAAGMGNGLSGGDGASARLSTAGVCDRNR